MRRRSSCREIIWRQDLALTAYANKQHSPVKGVIFSNSDNDYSLQLKRELTDALPQSNGTLVEAVDITNNNNTSEAIAIARANGGSLPLLGGDKLYNAQLLVDGDSAIGRGNPLGFPDISLPLVS